MAEVLGSKLYVTGFALSGSPPAEQMQEIMRQVVNFIGMSTGDMQAQVWSYPLPSGQGGLGETIIQPLVESFLISDSWPGLEKVYVVLASCRKYDPIAVASLLAQKIGPLLSIGQFEL